MTWRAILTLLPCAAVWLAACGGGQPAVAVAVRDSAGIRLVENRLESDNALPLRVLDAPDVTLGAVEGSEEYLFHQVAGATRLTDGRIVVLDRGSAQLRFYDLTGRFLLAAGSRGEGPGEFDSPSGLRRAGGDSLVIWDLFRRPRSYYYDSNGTFARDVRYERGPIVRAQLEDSMMAVRQIPIRDDLLLLVGQSFRPPPRIRPARVLLFLPTENRSVSLGGYPNAALGGIRFAPTLRGFRQEPLPFAIDVPRTGIDTQRQTRVFLGDLDAGAFYVFDDTGSLERVIRTVRPPRPVPSGLVDDIYRVQLARAIERNFDIDEFDRAWGAYDVDALPPFFALVSTETGDLWSMRFPLPNEADTRFDIYDPEGILIGTVAFPGSSQPLEIGLDHAIMLRTDENGVEFVEVYVNRSFVPPASR